jgi:hypothetical protein
MRDANATCHFPARQRRRITGAEPKAVPLVVFVLDRLSRKHGGDRREIRDIGSKLSLQRGANFREGMGNGLRLWMAQNDGINPKRQKEIMFHEKTT